ncbi:MAG: HigA family addiction module antidote protein [Treponema sp.]|nr:HigA family addiction module antidote protein [Treponema sp.]
MAKQKLVLPGDALKAKMDEFLVSIPKLATDINMSPSMVRNFLSGKAKIGIPVALKLAKYFGTTFEYWNELQLAYDLEVLKKDEAIAKELKDVPKAKKPTAKQIAAATEGKEDKKTAKRRSAKNEEPVKRGGAVSDKPAKTASRRGAKKPKETEEKIKAPSPRRSASRSAKKVSPEPEPVPEAPKKPNTILIKKSENFENSRPVPDESDESLETTNPTDQDLF